MKLEEFRDERLPDRREDDLRHNGRGLSGSFLFAFLGFRFGLLYRLEIESRYSALHGERQMALGLEYQHLLDLVPVGAGKLQMADRNEIAGHHGKNAGVLYPVALQKLLDGVFHRLGRYVSPAGSEGNGHLVELLCRNAVFPALQNSKLDIARTYVKRDSLFAAGQKVGYAFFLFGLSHSGSKNGN